MLTYASPLGLYSEEIGPTGEQAGNFPQAFSHLALVRAAMHLDRQLDGLADKGSRARGPANGNAVGPSLPGMDEEYLP